MRKRLFWWLLALLVIAVAAMLYVSNCCLKVTKYTQSAGVEQEVKILFLSDIHGETFGENNGFLIDLIAAQKPDLILIPGDLLNTDADEEELVRLEKLLGELVKIAPTYFSLGNHETGYAEKNGKAFLERLQKTGAVLLENSFVGLHLGGSVIRLGGMGKHAYQNVDPQTSDPETYAFLQEFTATENYKIMLAHRPESFFFGVACKTWDVDLILAGHTHGGLVRIPGVGGLYAPIQEWLPEVDYGRYEFDGNTMLVTSGLAGYGWVPRVMNRPEICVVTLIPEE